VAAAINEARQQQQQQLQDSQQMLANAIINAQQARNQRLQLQMMEASLVQSGFKLVTVSSQEQKRAVDGLAQGKCSAVMYNGKLFYVFPTATKDSFYVGKQAQFDAYKKHGGATITTAGNLPETRRNFFSKRSNNATHTRARQPITKTNKSGDIEN
jgi:hypothetical protein